ncbi:MAG: F390 synthetase-related protein [Armatimonadota bacterium]
MKVTQLAPTAWHFLAARQRWRGLGGEKLRQFQTQRARRMIAYACAHAPFYREYWAGHDLNDWENLPVVGKQEMMAHFNSFNTRGIDRDEAMGLALSAEQSRDFTPTLRGLTVGLSSGTSGHRGLFLVSPHEQAMWAGVILSRTLHRLRPRGYRLAFFLRSNSNLYEQTHGLLVSFRYFDLMAPLADAVAGLHAFQPDIVVGPPLLLGMLAQACRRGELRIRPERLISVAEVLEPQDRVDIENAFQVPVGQIYQCTEGLIAATCAHGSLHIQEDIVAVQCEPLNGLPGEDARVTPIVTDLWRAAQPIIRYRLNDVLQLGKPCPCGSSFRVIQAIEGRCDDSCYFLDDQGERPFFPDTVRRMILLADEVIEDYQAVQERPGHLRIHVQVPGDRFTGAETAVRESVNRVIAQYGCRPATVEIVQGLCELPSGVKRRRVRRVADPERALVMKG